MGTVIARRIVRDRFFREGIGIHVLSTKCKGGKEGEEDDVRGGCFLSIRYHLLLRTFKPDEDFGTTKSLVPSKC